MNKFSQEQEVEAQILSPLAALPRPPEGAWYSDALVTQFAELLHCRVRNRVPQACCAPRAGRAHGQAALQGHGGHSLPVPSPQ